jgi:hypothetical protein
VPGWLGAIPVSFPSMVLGLGRFGVACDDELGSIGPVNGEGGPVELKGPAVVVDTVVVKGT